MRRCASIAVAGGAGLYSAHGRRRAVAGRHAYERPASPIMVHEIGGPQVAFPVRRGRRISTGSLVCRIARTCGRLKRWASRGSWCRASWVAAHASATGAIVVPDRLRDHTHGRQSAFQVGGSHDAAEVSPDGRRADDEGGDGGGDVVRMVLLREVPAWERSRLDACGSCGLLPVRRQRQCRVIPRPYHLTGYRLLRTTDL